MRTTTQLRQLLLAGELIVAPGAADALVARIIEQAGFPALYLTGAGVAYTTVGPDLGLLGMSEMVNRLEYICEAVRVPVIADGDTGYGNALNVIRTVKAYEKAGAAAIQLEDQVMPKKCGHLAGKQLIEASEMVHKIKAAVDARLDSDFVIVARTDARAVLGLNAAIERAQLYLEAGADVIFVEAPESIEEMKEINCRLNAPTLANMVEGGKTPLLPNQKLKEIGYNIVIYPNSAIRVMTKAVSRLMDALKESGTTQGQLDQMFLFNQVNNIIGLDRWKELEKKYQ
ncbi:isocitrate lyase/PEP mutase family protein [Paradesulfitobacterium ferrireducens]|uniref:isocitrate lyase/PEP mutase family protein n=1 Tax=Paradesulfitobacterium ferrireducens TaxID=2816476 RepID=UPI001A9066C3|nr:oxaloacetate decarboxylase [Paradesulfitobacterium ferrireducens]